MHVDQLLGKQDPYVVAKLMAFDDPSEPGFWGSDSDDDWDEYDEDDEEGYGESDEDEEDENDMNSDENAMSDSDEEAEKVRHAGRKAAGTKYAPGLAHR